MTKDYKLKSTHPFVEPSLSLKDFQGELRTRRSQRPVLQFGRWTGDPQTENCV